MSRTPISVGLLTAAKPVMLEIEVMWREKLRLSVV
jgi:hypothetical protein